MFPRSSLPDLVLFSAKRQTNKKSTFPGKHDMEKNSCLFFFYRVKMRDFLKTWWYIQGRFFFPSYPLMVLQELDGVPKEIKGKYIYIYCSFDCSLLSVLFLFLEMYFMYKTKRFHSLKIRRQDNNCVKDFVLFYWLAGQ